MEPSDLLQYVGAALKEERKRKRLSQTELARVSGLHQGAISRLERGGYNVKLKTLLVLVDALKLDLAIVDREPSTE